MSLATGTFHGVCRTGRVWRRGGPPMFWQARDGKPRPSEDAHVATMPLLPRTSVRGRLASVAEGRSTAPRNRDRRGARRSRRWILPAWNVAGGSCARDDGSTWSCGPGRRRGSVVAPDPKHSARRNRCDRSAYLVLAPRLVRDHDSAAPAAADYYARLYEELA